MIRVKFWDYFTKKKYKEGYRYYLDEKSEYRIFPEIEYGRGYPGGNHYDSDIDKVIANKYGGQKPFGI
jgi:hypothetical protein